VTRSAAEVDRVLQLAEDGHNQCEIARRTGIPRRTINDWVDGRTPVLRSEHDDHGRPCRGCNLALELKDPVFRDYSYLLGMYLGDGCISQHARGVFRLRITLDRRYQLIVRECVRAVSSVLPANRVTVYPHRHENLDEVSSFSKHWPCLLPQHGAGLKHRRRIALVDWQREVVDRHPWCFLRGLIHSDGSRFMNPIRKGKRTYRYPRYTFSNRSRDLQRLFCTYCEVVGVEWRQMNRWNISVARRDSVALMDRYIGPKR
jgi:Homeodomain-like domain-containing protein